MADQQYILSEILGDLKLLRDHENELIRALSVLVDSPEVPGVPEHIRLVFKLAKEAFNDSAAQFLIHPHWKLNYEAPLVVAQSADGAHEVGLLLGRIIHGICV